MPAQFHQPHRLLQPQPPDALPDPLLRNEPLGRLRIRLRLLRLFARYLGRVSPSIPPGPALADRMRPVSNYCPDQKIFTIPAKSSCASPILYSSGGNPARSPRQSTHRCHPIAPVSPLWRLRMLGAAGSRASASPRRTELLCSAAGSARAPASARPARSGTPAAPTRAIPPRREPLKASPPPSISPAQTSPPIAGHRTTSAK